MTLGTWATKFYMTCVPNIHSTNHTKKPAGMAVVFFELGFDDVLDRVPAQAGDGGQIADGHHSAQVFDERLEPVRVARIRRGKGGHLEAFAAGGALALGHFGHQKDRLEADGDRLQLPETTPFASDLLAAADGALDPIGPHRQHKPNAPVPILRLHVIVAFPHPKRMIQQTLTHASCYKILKPDKNFPEEPNNGLAVP